MGNCDGKAAMEKEEKEKCNSSERVSGKAYEKAAPPSVTMRGSGKRSYTAAVCDVPSVGREVIVFGVRKPKTSHLNGMRGKVVGHEGQAPIINFDGKVAAVSAENLLCRKHEVVAYYCGSSEVRWFASSTDRLVRWVKSQSGTINVTVVRSLVFKHVDKTLEDETGVGSSLPHDDWRRIADHLAPAAERCGVGHNLPTREVRMDGWWKIGASVTALWEGDWHTGSIAKSHANGTVDILWDEDSTLTPNVLAGNVRPWIRKDCSTYNVSEREITLEPSLLSNPHLDFDDVYETGKKLGEGGFGEVYEVVHKATGKKYAAKVLPVTHDTKDEVREVIGSRKEPITVGSKVQGTIAAWADLQEISSSSSRKSGASRYLQSKFLSGFVVYTGCCPYGEEGWLGVVLDVPCGSHNGTVDGVKYFDAPLNRGAFIKVRSCRPVRPHVTELWGGLDHPNLCKLVDWRAGRHVFGAHGHSNWGEDEVYGPDSENYMVCIMMHCPGGDLENILKSPSARHLHIGERAAAHIMRSILSCLQYLHEKGIVHHDLKVSNVLLEDVPAVGPFLPTVKICDMGLSKFIGDGEVGGGTLLYMAPELLLAWRWRPGTAWSRKWKEVAAKFGVMKDISKAPPSYDQKIDIFAAGVICYGLITRGKRHPFHLDGSWTTLPENEHLANIAESIVEGVRFPDMPWARVSEDCKSFIKLLLSAKSVNRPTAEKALAHPWLTKMAPVQSGRRESLGPDGLSDEASNMEMGSLLARMKEFRLREAVRGKGPPKGVPLSKGKGSLHLRVAAPPTRRPSTAALATPSAATPRRHQPSSANYNNQPKLPPGSGHRPGSRRN
eukprot:TRINITY_DN9742_c0_g6_i1.p1 TRINITY_DN9742_c0_g6~~TRINITY_DN9742_c0_g6_i1.p1  ORF type:complete len:835 (+),score=151.66 TRINITY_DN9742_c0_g6_i1:39-2543(+)